MRPLWRLAAGLAVLAGFLQPGLADNGLSPGTTTSPDTAISTDASTSTGSTDTITFAATDFGSGVLVYSRSAKEFQFTVNEADVTITQAQLYDVTKGQALGTYSGTTPTGQVTLSMYAPTGAGQIGSVTIDDPGMLFTDVEDGIDADGDVLYFVLSWTRASGVEGTSSSRTFGYAKMPEEVATLQSAFTNTQAAVLETKSSTATAAPTTSSSSSAKTPGITSTSHTNTKPATAATSTAANGATTISSGPQTTQTGTNPIGKKKKSSLSGGAIAGIAVGVIVGVLLLLGLLAFFLKRRRAPQKLVPVSGGDGGDSGGGGGGGGGVCSAVLGGAAAGRSGAHSVGRPGGRSGARSGGLLGRFASPSTKSPLLSRNDTVKPYQSPYGVPDLGGGDEASPHAEKQAAAAARAMDDSAYGDSPLSYSDAVPAAPGTMVGAASAAREEHSPEPPYWQVPAREPAPVAAAASAAAAAGSPSSRPLVNPLLIEEDMTPEQLARVEAEERELDEAISHQQRNR